MRRGWRLAYLFAAWTFVVGVLAQVFLAGMVIVAGRMGWDNHAGLGHTLALPLLVMLVTVYLGRFPGRMKGLTWLLFLVYVVQADILIFLRGSLPVVAAFHPVLALVDFALAWSLAMRARSVLGQTPQAEAVRRLEAVPGD